MTEKRDPNAVHRRHRLVLDLEADDLPELARTLERIAFDLETKERDSAMVTSGGYASGFHYQLKTDPTMTGDRYREEILEWRRRRRMEQGR